MQQPATQRRLAAILAADAVGFSRMMGADEEGTHERLKRVREEGTCDPGGVALSASAYDQVRGKVALEFRDRGEHRVKNIARPVRVYAVDLRAHGIAFKRKWALRFRPFPVILVLIVLAGIVSPW